MNIELRKLFCRLIGEKIETENAIIFFSPFLFAVFITWFGKSIRKIAFYIRSTFDRTIEFDQIRNLFRSIFLIPISNNFVISIFQKLQIKLIN